MRSLRMSVTVLVCTVLLAIGSVAQGAVQELTFMHYLGANDGIVMDELVKQFNATHPGIVISASFAQNMKQKLLVSVAGGAAPDIALSPPENISAYANAGAAGVLDLARMQNTRVNESLYLPAAWKGAFYQGKMYGIPLGMGAIALYMNPDMFSQAGLPTTAPATREDMERIEKRLQRDADGDGNLDQVGLELPIVADLRHVWYSVLLQNGGSVFRGNDVAFADEAGVKTLTDLTNYFVQNRLVIDPRLSMFQGKSAMRMNGTWMKTAIVQAGILYQTAPFPLFGKTPAAWSGAQYIIVPPKDNNAERLAAVYTFVDWMAGQGLAWAIGSGHLPSRRDVIRHPDFRRSTHHFGFAEESEYLNFYPMTPEWDKIGDLFAPMVHNALKQVASPLTLLQEAVNTARGRLAN